jgi:predicted NBD/HSP70 family sugar kinase
VLEHTRAARGSRLRELSRSLVLRELSDAGPQTQASLVRATGLSRATVASIIDELRSDGRVGISTGGKSIGRGRPPALVHLATDTHMVVGVDFGHAHLAVAIADLSGTILAERREPMDVHHAAEESLDRAAALIAELIVEAAAQGITDRPVMVGVGVPGPIEVVHASGNGAPGGRVCAGTVLPSWAGYDPAAELAKRTGLPVLAENDANLGALGEQRFGAARGVDNVVFVKVSSGIGTGLILGGRLYRGSRGAAGEIGHVQVREDGALCRCGSRGCLETVSSADAALALLAPAHGRPMTATDLFELEAAGDPGVLRLLTDMGTAIGRIVAVIAANLDPNMLIVGGSMARSALVDSVAVAINRFNQPYVAADMRVTAAALGERASLMGSIALAIGAASGHSPIAGAAAALPPAAVSAAPETAAVTVTV